MQLRCNKEMSVAYMHHSFLFGNNFPRHSVYIYTFVILYTLYEIIENIFFGSFAYPGDRNYLNGGVLCCG